MDNDEACALELWCVRSIREFSGSPLRHTRWFTTEDSARQYADEVERASKGKVLSVCKYSRCGGSAK